MGLPTTIKVLRVRVTSDFFVGGSDGEKEESVSQSVSQSLFNVSFGKEWMPSLIFLFMMYGK